jgi:hypothetical protein
MNLTLKVAIASALSLGAAAANASIALNSTGSSDVILFAEIVNSSNQAVASYAADTGVSVADAYAGTSHTFAADANLNAFFAADAAGDTILWGVEGGQYTGTNAAGTQAVAGTAKNVTTTSNPSLITAKTSSQMATQNSVLTNAINQLNANLGAGNSVEGPAPSGAGIWDTTGGNQIYNWNANGPTSNITGTGTVALYDMTGAGSLSSHLALVTNGNVSFSSAGLVFSTASPVPLPPAVWMFGSGLLGLVGVARRKSLKA